MANNRELLKEALADAKSLREMAITNAKAALEESFAPQIKSMLSNKLQEMELEEDDFYEGEDKGEVDEELNLEEILAELEGDDQDPNPVTEVEDEVEDEGDEVKGGEESDEPMELEDMSEDDLKGFIESVIADMVEAGDLEAGEDMEGEEGEEGEDDVNIDELLAEIESMDEMGGIEEYDSLDEEGGLDEIKILGLETSSSKRTVADFMKKYPELMGKAKNKSPEDDNVKKLMSKFSSFLQSKEGGEITGGARTNYVEALYKTLGIDAESIYKDPTYSSPSGDSAVGKSKLKSELNEAYRAIKTLKSELNEVNLLNAKLLYTNRIFKSKNLTESQKVKVLSTFDKASNVNEVELVYETLNGTFNTKKKPMNENLGRASRTTGSTKTLKSPIIENAAYKRMRELAFYDVKH